MTNLPPQAMGQDMKFFPEFSIEPVLKLIERNEQAARANGKLKDGERLLYLIKELIECAVKAEREACAKECDALASVEGIAQKCAAAIRARGDK